MYSIMRKGVSSMEIQMKKGLLDVCVLALLKRGDSYGYQIVSELSPLIEVSESTLYPILRRLETAGQLVTYTREHGGRLRRYYRITRDGLGRLEKFNREWRDMRKIYAFIQGEDE
jgi:PadR family transcriptional regulator PadR